MSPEVKWTMLNRVEKTVQLLSTMSLLVTKWIAVYFTVVTQFSLTQLNSTQPEITDAGVWHLYVRIIINKTIL